MCESIAYGAAVHYKLSFCWAESDLWYGKPRLPQQVQSKIIQHGVQPRHNISQRNEVQEGRLSCWRRVLPPTNVKISPPCWLTLASSLQTRVLFSKVCLSCWCIYASNHSDIPSGVCLQLWCVSKHQNTHSWQLPSLFRWNNENFISSHQLRRKGNRWMIHEGNENLFGVTIIKICSIIPRRLILEILVFGVWFLLWCHKRTPWCNAWLTLILSITAPHKSIASHQRYDIYVRAKRQQLPDHLRVSFLGCKVQGSLSISLGISPIKVRNTEVSPCTAIFRFLQRLSVRWTGFERFYLCCTFLEDQCRYTWDITWLVVSLCKPNNNQQHACCLHGASLGIHHFGVK